MADVFAPDVFVADVFAADAVAILRRPRGDDATERRGNSSVRPPWRTYSWRTCSRRTYSRRTPSPFYVAHGGTTLRSALQAAGSVTHHDFSSPPRKSCSGPRPRGPSSNSTYPAACERRLRRPLHRRSAIRTVATEFKRESCYSASKLETPATEVEDSREVFMLPRQKQPVPADYATAVELRPLRRAPRGARLENDGAIEKRAGLTDSTHTA